MPTSPTQVRVNLTLPRELHETLQTLADATPGQTVAGFVRDMLLQQHAYIIPLAAAVTAEKVEDAEAGFAVLRTMAAQIRAAAELLDRQIDGYEQAIEIEKKKAAGERTSA
jgi:hypothetical protein